LFHLVTAFASLVAAESTALLAGSFFRLVQPAELRFASVASTFPN
jgi:hypothetical protein